MKHEVGECEELFLSLHVSHLAFLTCKRSYPILTVKLFHELQWEAGVTTAIQFPYEQLPCRQGWQFIYFNLTDWENRAHQKQPAKPLYSGQQAWAGD